tara:strand:+ start:6904 stop:7314 length:411 start_codon:yes stop_codon:yes gene_type:complete
MKNKLICRILKEEDYSVICDWWKWWRWPAIPKEMLPDNGKSGFMIEKNNIPIVSGFLYLTNSTGALLEWIVSNPNYREKDRQKAIELLLSEAERICKKMGITYVFSIGRNKSLIETHKRLGWKVDEKPSHEIIKNI